MHIKRSKHIASKTGAVKNAGLALAAFAALSAGIIPSTASAKDFLTVDKEFTVTFLASELATAHGMEVVYEKLGAEASKACKSLSFTSKRLGETFEDCVSDLMNQFVESSGMEVLRNYHMTQNTITATK